MFLPFLLCQFKIHIFIYNPFAMISPFFRLFQHASRSFFLFIFALLIVSDQLNCLDFSYSSFPPSAAKHFHFNGESQLALGALHITMDKIGDPMVNISGRILYKTPFSLRKKKGKVESFITKFVLRIAPQTNPGGEGLAFILTKDLDYIPPKSFGPCLGIVSSSTDDPNRKQIIAVEFDTKKSYDEDLDDNHVGVDINSIKSWVQISLSRYGVNLSSGTGILVMINYNGTTKEFNVSVSINKTMVNVISMPLDLSDYLSSDYVYAGFSASTGTNTQLNVIREWYFTGGDSFVSIPPWVWVGISLGSAVLISIIAGLVCWRIKKARDDKSCLDQEIESYGIGPKKYQLKELKSVTSNFNSQNVLGRGGFGIVYKGILKGEEVAVKRVSENSKQGRKNMIAEISTIGSLDHKNLVKLIGWCYEKNELLLVYEYMPNGSLDKLLFPECEEENTILSWERRYNIFIGIAQSLDYLHNECSKRVLHRDIKPSNIMLDSEYNACLGDFGLARMVKRSEKTHHTTHEIAGTRAYMAPEIFLTGKATTQTDVYAFGVLVLEVICGRRPGIRTLDGELSYSIVDWVWEFYKLDIICGVIDPKLNENFNKDEAERVLLTALACCQPNPYTRPSIRSCLQVLMAEILPVEVPLEKPTFSWPISAPTLIEEHDPLHSGGMLSLLSSFNGR